MNQDTTAQSIIFSPPKIADRLWSIFRFPRTSQNLEVAKLLWLVKLRWLAIGVFFLFAGPAIYLGALTSVNIPNYLGILGILLVSNLITQLNITKEDRSTNSGTIFLQLTFDLFFLAGILGITKGYENPLVGLFLLNASLGGLLLPSTLGFIFLILTHFLISLLQFRFFLIGPLEFDHGRIISFVIFHFLLFLFWLVMRSLGSFIQKQNQTITENKITREKQNRLQSLGALAAGFSHEFSSPLQTIKLRLARLERNEQSEDLKEALGAIEQCELVIKQMNSAQLDPREFQWKSVNLSELTSDILGFWQEAHPSARIVAKIQPNCRAILPPLNYAQAVQNLLDNAFEANPKEAIAVHLSESQDKFVLEISDGGPGFSNLVFEKIGEPFVTTKESGTGLGLYIADLLAKSLGGQLLLANIPQGGAKVTLSWPVNRRQNE